MFVAFLERTNQRFIGFVGGGATLKSFTKSVIREISSFVFLWLRQLVKALGDDVSEILKTIDILFFPTTLYTAHKYHTFHHNTLFRLIETTPKYPRVFYFVFVLLFFGLDLLLILLEILFFFSLCLWYARFLHWSSKIYRWFWLNNV